MPEEVPPRRSDMSVAWSFAVFAAVILLIIVGWGFGGRGGGWGRGNEMAHMLPPAVSSENSPATRAWAPPPTSAH
jgi:hypothetical protein